LSIREIDHRVSEDAPLPEDMDKIVLKPKGRYAAIYQQVGAKDHSDEYMKTIASQAAKN
jgi:hypothetical protein